MPIFTVCIFYPFTRIRGNRFRFIPVLAQYTSSFVPFVVLALLRVSCIFFKKKKLFRLTRVTNTQYRTVIYVYCVYTRCGYNFILCILTLYNRRTFNDLTRRPFQLGYHRSCCKPFSFFMRIRQQTAWVAFLFIYFIIIFIPNECFSRRRWQSLSAKCVLAARNSNNDRDVCVHCVDTTIL